MNVRGIVCALIVLFVTVACGQKTPSPPQAPASALPPTEAAGVASRDFGDHVVHFNALSTEQLTPEVAKSYSIVRSRNRALLTVSVIKEVEGTTGKSVPASVTAMVANDTGQVKDSNVREIREGDTFYYIADYPVSNAETLVFTLDVIPAGETRSHRIRFTQTFYGK